MRPFLPAAALVALSLASGCLHARGPAAALERRLGVEIVGARAVDPDLVALRLVVKGLRKDDVDVQGVLELYASRGYPDAKVEVVEVGGGSGRLRIQITEGPFLHVSALSLEGLDELPGARAWSAALPLTLGGPFSIEGYQATRELLRAAARGAGYPDPYVIGTFSVQPRTAETSVSFFVDPGVRGAPWVFGPVFAAGFRDGARRDLVHAELARIAPRGQPLDPTRLDAVRARLLELGSWLEARVVLGAPDEARREYPILVFVRER